MAIKHIPLTNAQPNQNVFTTLDGIDVELRLRWSDRDSHYYLTVLDSTGTVLVGATRAVVASDVLKYVQSPPGNLVFVNTTNDGEEPSLTNLNQGVFLYYVEAL